MYREEICDVGETWFPVQAPNVTTQRKRHVVRKSMAADRFMITSIGEL